jgi:Ca2+/Na+ antiporter
VDFNEFVCGVVRYINSHQQILEGTKQKGLELLRLGSSDLEAGDGDEENPEDEEEEMPEDLAHLSPEEQQQRLKMRAAYYLIIGTGLVIIFSDPMVNVLSEIGTRTVSAVSLLHHHLLPPQGIGAFSVSFVLAPLASNASELIAAYKYSLKKTTTSISISISTLQGAACMNNTFGLGIFMVLIYTQSLAWQYLAETLSILFVQICLFFLVITRRTHTVLDAWIILSLYPLSLVFVAVLESLGWN